jgi:hypothetical protein
MGSTLSQRSGPDRLVLLLQEDWRMVLEGGDWRVLPESWRILSLSPFQHEDRQLGVRTADIIVPSSSQGLKAPWWVTLLGLFQCQEVFSLQNCPTSANHSNRWTSITYTIPKIYIISLTSRITHIKIFNPIFRQWSLNCWDSLCMTLLSPAFFCLGYKSPFSTAIT